jgi:large subunit ribosomal protein L1
MNKADIKKALELAKKNSPKRKFKQTFDLIVSLQGLDLKKTEHQVNTFLPLHFSNSKKVSIGALVGPELYEQAKEVCDEAVLVDDFGKYSDKKLIKQLSTKHDFFIAQATIMPKIATTFGRVFGPKGKMPNPKAGCVVPPNASLKPLYERLQKTIRLRTLNQPVIQCAIGKEDSKEEELIDNVLTIYNSLTHTLPNGEHNIRDIMIKLTMGPSVIVGAKKDKKAPKEEKKAEEPVKEEATEETKEIEKTEEVSETKSVSDNPKKE